MIGHVSTCTCVFFYRPTKPTKGREGNVCNNQVKGQVHSTIRLMNIFAVIELKRYFYCAIPLICLYA